MSDLHGMENKQSQFNRPASFTKLTKELMGVNQINYDISSYLNTVISYVEQKSIDNINLLVQNGHIKCTNSEMQKNLNAIVSFATELRFCLPEKFVRSEYEYSSSLYHSSHFSLTGNQIDTTMNNIIQKITTLTDKIGKSVKEEFLRSFVENTRSIQFIIGEMHNKLLHNGDAQLSVPNLEIQAKTRANQISKLKISVKKLLDNTKNFVHHAHNLQFNLPETIDNIISKNTKN